MPFADFRCFCPYCDYGVPTELQKAARFLHFWNLPQAGDGLHSFFILKSSTISGFCLLNNRNCCSRTGKKIPGSKISSAAGVPFYAFFLNFLCFLPYFPFESMRCKWICCMPPPPGRKSAYLTPCPAYCRICSLPLIQSSWLLLRQLLLKNASSFILSFQNK